MTANSSNDITTKLKESYEGLELKVKEHTPELSKEIEERRRTEKALKLSEARVREILESAPDAMFVINGQGKIVLINSQAEKIFGYMRKELLGLSVEILIPEHFRKQHIQHRADYYSNPRTQQMGSGQNLFGLHKNGKEIPVEISLSTHQTQEGMMVLSIVRDITDRKRLEGVVLQSEKMAAVGQLAGGVAHEINNPLGVILGFAQGVVKRLQPGDAFEMSLKSIEREALRCKGLAQNLLAFSRTGKIEKEETDLNQTLESVLSLISAQAKIKSIELIKELTPNLPKIFANKNQIQQITVNLCNNAMDAMSNGGKLTIRTKKTKLNNKDAVEIQIEDTSLGLSFVYEIIQKHERLIKVESEVGRGVMF